MKRLIVLAIVVIVGAAAWYWSSRRASHSKGLPATVNDFKQMPGGAATIDAGEYVIARLKEGGLPGFSKDEHGTLVIPNIKPPQEQTEAYPVLRVICLRKNGGTSEYYYRVIRESEGAPWQLRRAWRASPEGRVLQEYTLQ